MKRNLLFKFCLLGAPLILGACMLFPATSAPGLAPSLEPGMIHTAAAQTIVAQLTQSAGSTAVAQLTQLAGGFSPPGAALASPTPAYPLPATATPTSGLVFNTPPPPIIIRPTATLLPPFIPPAPTLWAPPAWTPPLPPSAGQPCNWVQFLNDVSISYGSLMTPGQAFSKTWRLRNIGSCAWGKGYTLAFVSGDRMQARSAYGLPRLVRPGDSLEVTVDFVAPASSGNYRGYWMLSDPSGQTFGFGPNAQTPFWVDISVRSTDLGSGYNFVANYCQARWNNGMDNLPCPGDPDSPFGSVRRLNDPTLETGKHENEPALWTRPNAAQGGTISGLYPAIKVQAGDRFLSDIGCLSGSKGCNVVFYLDYVTGGQAPRNLGAWAEVYDRQINRVDVDLSGLAGQNVQLILRVENRSKSGADGDAFWLGAQIRRGGPVDPGWTNIPAVQTAIETLARDLNVPGSSVAVTQVEAVQWPNACLGIDQPGQMCAQVITPGYRVILTVNGRNYEVHTNQAGSIALWVRR